MTHHPTPPPGPLPPARITPVTPRERAPRSARRKRITTVATVGAVLAGIAAGSALLASQPAAGGDRYSTVTVSRGSVVQRLNSSGTVSKVNEMSTRFPASGTVLEVPVAVGDTVAAGDVLAVLDDAPLRATLLQAQAEVDAAALAQAELKAAEREASRTPARPSGSGAALSGTVSGAAQLGAGAQPGADASAPPTTDGGGTQPGTEPGGTNGGAPALELPAPPEIPLDLAAVETAVSGADAALALVVERQAVADKALAAMTDACAVAKPGTKNKTGTTKAGSSKAGGAKTDATKQTHTRTPKPKPSPTASPGDDGDEGHDGADKPQPSASPSPSASAPAGPGDPAACQAALAKTAEAQASLTQAQAQLTAANTEGLDALRAAQAVLAKAVEDLGAWLTTITGMLGSPQQPGPSQPPAPQPPTQPQPPSVQPPMPQPPVSQPPSVDLPIDQPVGGGAGPGRSSLASAEVALAKAKRALASAQDDVDAATMRAPMGGTVTALPFTVGATASETDRAVVTAPGAIRVTIHVPASMFLYVTPGQQAILRAPGGAEATARVASKTLIPGEKGYPVTLVSPESGAEGFAAGMTASVSIDVSSATDVIVAPLSAVTRTGGTDAGSTEGTVRVLRGPEPEEVPVRLGSIGDTHVEVVSGLREGDRLVVGDATLPLPGLDLGR